MNNLKNIQYTEGDCDCYGLFRKYFKQYYDLELTNYARPLSFWEANLDLISQNLNNEGFEVIDTGLDRLELGDGIVMVLSGSRVANHLGVYVGNNQFLHHLYKQPSRVENYGSNWRRRTLTIIRHPEVTFKNSQTPIPSVNIQDLMPPHVRQANTP